MFSFPRLKYASIKIRSLENKKEEGTSNCTRNDPVNALYLLALPAGMASHCRCDGSIGDDVTADQSADNVPSCAYSRAARPGKKNLEAIQSPRITSLSLPEGGRQ